MFANCILVWLFWLMEACLCTHLIVGQIFSRSNDDGIGFAHTRLLQGARVVHIAAQVPELHIVLFVLWPVLHTPTCL